MSDPVSDARQKVAAEARAAAEAACEAQSVAEDARAEIADGLDAFAGDLFDQFLAVAEKKGEAPEQAAPKVAKIVIGRTAKEAAQRAAKAPKAEEAVATGQVTGKTSGVNRKILFILNAVSAHYGQPLAVISGKRDPKKVATAIFIGWNGFLRNGKAMPYFRTNEKLRTHLDELKQKKDRPGFESHLLSKAEIDAISPHMTGDAVDLPQTTEPWIVAALATCLNHRAEKNTEGTRCHHFDSTRLIWPIAPSTRDRWPRPD